MKNLLIDYYADGFNVEEIDCWDMTLACACGVYNKENYYFYSFLYAMFNNWPWSNKPVTEQVLKLLGVGQNEYHVNSGEELINKIYDAIDLGNPVLMLLRYNKIFFNSLYKKESDLNHVLLITGYDKERQLLNVRDYLFAKKFTKAVVQGSADIFIDFAIKDEYVIEMWQETKKEGVNSLFILERNDDPLIADYESLLQFFLENVSVDKKNYERYNTAAEGDYKLLRQKLYRNVSMLLRVVRRAFNEGHCILRNIQGDKLEEAMQQMIKKRDMYASKMIKEMMRDQTISDEAIHVIADYDQELYRFIKEVFEQTEFVKIITQGNEKNIALHMPVTCDSENATALAINAVNGKIEDEFDCWLSDFEHEQHWLVVDLKRKRAANRFLIRHHPYKKKLVTRDYCIEGSNDLQNWDVLTAVVDNDKHNNILNITPEEYRYYKLNIQKANNINENAARIFSFEIYE